MKKILCILSLFLFACSNDSSSSNGSGDSGGGDSGSDVFKSQAKFWEYKVSADEFANKWNKIGINNDTAGGKDMLTTATKLFMLMVCLISTNLLLLC